MSDKELRDGFKVILEQEMSAMIQTLENLIESHKTYGLETMQKTYLWRARHALADGKDWFKWERQRAAELNAVPPKEPDHE